MNIECACFLFRDKMHIPNVKKQSSTHETTNFTTISIDCSTTWSTTFRQFSGVTPKLHYLGYPALKLCDSNLSDTGYTTEASVTETTAHSKTIPLLQKEPTRR